MLQGSGLVKLYGVGGMVFTDGKADYHVRNGVLEVPLHLVDRARQSGFSEFDPHAGDVDESDGVAVEISAQFVPPDPEAEAAAAAAKASARVIALRALPVDERRAVYHDEVVAAGYSDEAAAQLVEQRLYFDELLAAGVAEDEAQARIFRDGEQRPAQNSEPATPEAPKGKNGGGKGAAKAARG